MEVMCDEKIVYSKLEYDCKCLYFFVNEWKAKNLMTVFILLHFILTVYRNFSYWAECSFKSYILRLSSVI